MFCQRRIRRNHCLNTMDVIIPYLYVGISGVIHNMGSRLGHIVIIDFWWKGKKANKKKQQTQANKTMNKQTNKKAQQTQIVELQQTQCIQPKISELILCLCMCVCMCVCVCVCVCLCVSGCLGWLSICVCVWTFIFSVSVRWLRVGLKCLSYQSMSVRMNELISRGSKDFHWTGIDAKKLAVGMLNIHIHTHIQRQTYTQTKHIKIHMKHTH